MSETTAKSAAPAPGSTLSSGDSLRIVHSEEPSAIDDPRETIFLDERPWGAFEQFTHNANTTVKILTVEAGSRLSLQRHADRDELWVVLDAEVVAEVGDRVEKFATGEKVWIPRGTLHRLENRGERRARVLEIAFGHFDEADIERLDDDYER